jgi:3-phenylpropionate/trans-cinnamate dioxygenase ferredoxin component
LGEWIEVARVDDIDTFRDFDVNGREILIIRKDENFYAVDNICSHEYSRLSDGEIWDDRVYCAKHGSSFDIKSGAVRGFPATEDVETFKVKVENDLIYIYMEELY